MSIIKFGNGIPLLRSSFRVWVTGRVHGEGTGNTFLINDCEEMF